MDRRGLCKFFKDPIGDVGECAWWAEDDTTVVPRWLIHRLNNGKPEMVCSQYCSGCPAWEKREDG